MSPKGGVLIRDSNLSLEREKKNQLQCNGFGKASIS